MSRLVPWYEFIFHRRFTPSTKSHDLSHSARQLEKDSSSAPANESIAEETGDDNVADDEEGDQEVEIMQLKTFLIRPYY